MTGTLWAGAIVSGILVQCLATGWVYERTLRVVADEPYDEEDNFLAGAIGFFIWPLILVWTLLFPVFAFGVRLATPKEALPRAQVRQ